VPPRQRRRTRSGASVPGQDGDSPQPQRRQQQPRQQQSRQPQSRQQQSRQQGQQGQQRRPQDQGPIAVLAQAAARVDAEVQRRRVTPTTRATFQAIGMLIRELRTQAKTERMPEVQRAATLKRFDGLAAALARTSAKEPSLFTLLTDDIDLLPGTNTALRELRQKAGLEVTEVEPAPPVETPFKREERHVVPQSVIARQLANPFLAPDYSAASASPRQRPRLLADWELLNPLLRAFETSNPGVTSAMALPSPAHAHIAPGLELMPHQAQVVEAAREGHRSFLLADEPGLGKTAQALLAAQAVNAYPLLVVVPNVVKTSWAREAEMWTPLHGATVIHSDGETVDAFCDIVIVNYDILDRHAGWLGNFGFRGMVVDEAHFIKNKTSQRSQNVLELSRKIRQRSVRPLLMALTGTPLINDIEDFLAIWEFLGWITDKEPSPDLLDQLEQHGMTPLDSDFYPAARQSVIDMGIVRRRKEEVAKDIPARRVADMPVELDGALGKSIRDAEQKLVRRLVKRYESALAARKDAHLVTGIDLELVRTVCGRELRDNNDENASGENVFSMMRRIGQAKAELAADYTAQLSRNAGKVVFFAKHIDVMDAAEAVFAKRGIGYSTIRGDQTTRTRTKSIDAFVNDPDVHVIVVSLTAGGVGINLQVSSNVVLAELSWTAAEQTQAIDRVHRIGQDQPVTAWRIIAAQTIDARVAELIGTKAGLAARALDGSDEEVAAVDVQLEALVAMLTDALNRV
jgi:SNF2-related domain/Helicase conserved C-terminal domain